MYFFIFILCVNTMTSRINTNAFFDFSCGGTDRRTVVRIYLDQVVGYTKEEDRLPLLQTHPNLVQTLTCVTDPVTETGSFALTFGGQTTSPIAINSTAAVVRTALEDLSTITKVGVRYVNVNVDVNADSATPLHPCSSDGSIRVFITLVDVSSSKSSKASFNQRATLEVAPISGVLSTSTVPRNVSLVLSVEQERLFTNDTTTPASFHVSGSVHARAIDGTVDFQAHSLDLQTERRLTIDKACASGYEIIYTLVSNGGTVVPLLSTGTNNLVSGPVTVFSGAPHHLGMMVLPDYIGAWLETTNQYSPMETQPSVGIYDLGHNLADWVREVFIVHVGGTRCVISSTDHTMKMHACLTLNVECIRTCLFIFLFDVEIQGRVGSILTFFSILLIFR